MKTFVISDTHFGHANIIPKCRPQFSSLEEMEETIVSNWNRVVGRDDRVYHLGDVAKTPQDAVRILPRLNGTKRLVVGNHDHLKSEPFLALFSRVELWRELGDEDGRVVLTHMPIERYLFRHGTVFNIHGHLHEETAPHGMNVCVSVEQIDYTPVDVEVYLSIAKTLRGKL